MRRRLVHFMLNGLLDKRLHISEFLIGWLIGHTYLMRTENNKHKPQPMSLNPISMEQTTGFEARQQSNTPA